MNIYITADSFKIEPVTTDPTIQSVTNLLLTALHALATDISPTPEAKEELYDMFNHAFSNFLQVFAPEIEMRPDITVEAILELENQFIEREKGCPSTTESCDCTKPGKE